LKIKNADSPNEIPKEQRKTFKKAYIDAEDRFQSSQEEEADVYQEKIQQLSPLFAKYIPDSRSPTESNGKKEESVDNMNVEQENKVDSGIEDL
jgi:hypothetical protein